MKFQTTSAIQTKKIAKELADVIMGKADKANRLIGAITSQSLQKKPLIIALKGDLGAGKTTFTQGFLRGLGVRGKIISPTFVLMKTYNLKLSRPISHKRSSGGRATYDKVIHMDCYRIKSSKEILDLNWKEIISPPAGRSKNIVLIEWPERIKNIIPRGAIKINLKHGKKENERILRIL